MDNYQQHALTFLKTLWRQVLLLSLLLSGARLVMFSVFADAQQLQNYDSAVRLMWLTGLRYDLRAVSILLAPLLVIGLLISLHRIGWRWLQRIAPWYLGGCAFLVSLIAIINYFYYQTYHTYIDIFAFGLIDDGPLAVLTTIWQDYPVVVSLLLVSLFAWLNGRLGRKTLLSVRQPRLLSRQVFVVYLLISLLLFFAMIRGSLSTFPLRRNDSQISSVAILNKLAPNGLMASAWAMGDRGDDIRFEPVTRTAGEQLRAQSGLTTLEARTPVNPWLAAHRPNVVMALMESMGSNMLVYDHLPDNDMLSALRPHFASDFVFRHFVSEGNGTAPTFAALFFQSPIQNLSHSSAQYKMLDDTPYATYKKAGYKVIFITSGSRMWRNLGTYLPRLGVDEIYDQSSLMERYPESLGMLTDWGVPDEFAFRLAQRLLAEAHQPLFISILTVTNHPPYKVPANYQPQPVHAGPEMMAHAEVNQQEQESIAATYQYATHALGEFISAVKSSPVGESTLIAATGDHQMRRLKAQYPHEQFLDRAVPFYLYVPKTILAQTTWRFDSLRPGSHKDIFPTLYAYSLSDTPYYALGGRNMLAEQDDATRAFGYNQVLWIDEQGVMPIGSNGRYLWDPANPMLTQAVAHPVSTEQQQRTTAYPALLHWQINAREQGVTGN
ncbi:LTA synthase family protein [Dickeya dianthicola]|uniref:LTA synthase family protein n=1 Tax=Dickeya dianthicola TaxID=204039 RepID=UPI0003D6DADC|nr:alkaline phosphatase family protein [Dickeya dianthicola]MBT1433878.1 sulfatase-like hydrolase/transferase [Dickeya dianthicola]MCA7003231.1 sulfatase-like hydrolase/transferase [Dickeya dianthicola]MCI4154596.1 sulfatase-like hydrolase/transferase [Dickeya dianthicola]